MSKYILISGKKGHGKNYFASVLEERLKEDGFTVKETAFAEPIKNFCHDVFGIAHEDMMTQEGKLKKTHLTWRSLNNKLWPNNAVYSNCSQEERGRGFKSADDHLTIRELLQIIGTDVWRDGFYGPIWAERVYHKKYNEDVVIVTDGRFRNEIETGRKFGAIIINIRNPKVKSNDTHPSEVDLDDYQFLESEIFINDVDGKSKILEYYKTILLPKLIHATN
jgi:hypothetical protein